jgi:hypothetical protein
LAAADFLEDFGARAGAMVNNLFESAKMRCLTQAMIRNQKKSGFGSIPSTFPYQSTDRGTKRWRRLTANGRAD